MATNLSFRRNLDASVTTRSSDVVLIIRNTLYYSGILFKIKSHKQLFYSYIQLNFLRLNFVKQILKVNVTRTPYDFISVVDSFTDSTYTTIISIIVITIISIKSKIAVMILNVN